MATATPTRIANSRAGATGSADDAPPTEAKKSKKKLIMVAAFLLVLAVGYFMFLKKSPAKDGPPEAGSVVAMDATTLNLADGHFLKLKLGLQTIKGVKAVDFDTSKAADIAVTEFSNRPMASLVTNEARAAIKADLLKKLEAAYPKKLMDVYFTEFVMQ